MVLFQATAAALKSGSGRCYFGVFKPGSCCHHLSVLGFVTVSLFYYSEENNLSVFFFWRGRAVPAPSGRAPGGHGSVLLSLLLLQAGAVTPGFPSRGFCAFPAA